jgi:hypothetical protein
MASYFQIGSVDSAARIYHNLTPGVLASPSKVIIELLVVGWCMITQ